MADTKRALRRVLVAASAVLVVATVWVVCCVVLIGHPHVDAVGSGTKLDAVVVLGPPDEDDRLGTAERMAAAGQTSVIVVSVNDRWQKTAVRFCAAPHPGLTVYCFHPDPATTRGEAEHVRGLAQQHGWKTMAVVTSTYHVARARMLFKRCLHDSPVMVASPTHASVGQWAYQFVYQSTAWVKAQFLRGC